MRRIKFALAFAGFGLALVGVSLENHRFVRGAIAVLLGALVLGVIERWQARHRTEAIESD
ncbi:MAG TPA: hypothetical protein VMG41_13835 [Gemmatimonadales bacterium]|nr:hypothetical protein [Gemmatimonadales bacterium]